jgi:hypothetical protein
MQAAQIKGNASNQKPNKIKRMRKIYIVVVLGVFILNACNKDTDIFVPDAGQVTGPDSTWYSSVAAFAPLNDLQQSLLLPPDLDSIEVGDNADTIHSASGLQCIFPPNSCVDSNGSPVNGKVYVQSFLLKGRGQFISMGLPTVSNGNLLVSGGVFSVQLQQGNANLQLATTSLLKIRYSDTGLSKYMKLFNGTIGSYEPFNWIQNSDPYDTVLVDNDEYQITDNKLQWINCDYFYGDTTNTNKTNISIKLPPNLTNVNTLAYVVFKDIRSIMQMNGDIGSKQFIINKVPVGLNATIITISKDGNFYYLGQQPVTTAMAAVSTPGGQPITIAPVRYSLDDIKYFLNSL